MPDKLDLVAMCCAAVLISGCNGLNDEFETAAVASTPQATQNIVSPNKATIEDFSESSRKASELGLPFPRLTPLASSQLAAAAPVEKTDKTSVADTTSVASVAAPSNTAPLTDEELFLTEKELKLLEEGEKFALRERKRKSRLPKSASSHSPVNDGSVVTAQAATFPTIDDILAKAKSGFDLKSYNSFLKSRSSVDTSCFPPELRRILSLVHKRYGTKPEISSGFRSVAYNRRIGGARGSYHTKCQAADIKVAGVSKYVLAKYLRTIPDIGGVGVYGCRGIVHVDVGPRRNWHRPCRKRRRA
ncbi:MAG: D-Ala-D-Ala carboxypeptidase family metallohydrolase [Hyphomicrobiales bacterium]